MPADHLLARFVPGVELYLNRDYAGALEFFSALIGGDPQIPPYVTNFVGDIALLSGDLEQARHFLSENSPVLKGDAERQIDRYTIRDDSRFAAIVDDLDARIAEMRARAIEAEKSGNWAPLRALVSST